MNTEELIRFTTSNPARYVQKATALIECPRRVGGNQFRHGMATWVILIDYRYYGDSVLLKAAPIHDLIEDRPGTDLDEIRHIDSDAPQVLELVLEVTRDREKESKRDYLKRLRDRGSERAQILKVADRIHNLTDLNTDVFNQEFIWHYLEETETFVCPMAERVNKDMAIELRDLIRKRWTYVGKWC